ncbi:hypothetical protein EDD15DRAFT_2191376 [Pisolithus albus]|nr:hypothetical protein EDD15DRAFT_2191376 [Pisolithus albus]
MYNLPHETAACACCQGSKIARVSTTSVNILKPTPGGRKQCSFNLATSKLCALGDYVHTMYQTFLHNRPLLLASFLFKDKQYSCFEMRNDQGRKNMKKPSEGSGLNPCLQSDMSQLGIPKSAMSAFQKELDYYNCERDQAVNTLINGQSVPRDPSPCAGTMGVDATPPTNFLSMSSPMTLPTHLVMHPLAHLSANTIKLAFLPRQSSKYHSFVDPIHILSFLVVSDALLHMALNIPLKQNVVHVSTLVSSDDPIPPTITSWEGLPAQAL